jgi:hypothetical protein
MNVKFLYYIHCLLLRVIEGKIKGGGDRSDRKRRKKM